MPGITYRSQKPGQTGYSVGQVSQEPLTWAVGAAVTVGAASGVLQAGGVGVGRLVWIKVPSSAAIGVYIDFGAVASAADMFIEAGESVFIATEQEIRAIRAGGSDVTVHIAVGVI
jgi:hypothetical protein